MDRWIGLALPGFPLRLPYGRATSEVESFAFEEMPRSMHAHNLWGNLAFACAQAWRHSATRVVTCAGAETNYRIGLHICQADGESVAKPIAELLTERDAEFPMENGPMPPASVKDQPSIPLPRMQSMADPSAPLAGRWAARWPEGRSVRVRAAAGGLLVHLSFALASIRFRFCAPESLAAGGISLGEGGAIMDSPAGKPHYS